MQRFKTRNLEPEWMDDLSISDERLETVLGEIDHVNRWLGGYQVSLAAFPRKPELRVLDVACGGGDFLCALHRWSKRHSIAVDATGIDLNPATIIYARERITRALGQSDASRIRLEVGDACAMPFADHSFDVAHAGLFLHHLPDDLIVHVLRELRRVAKYVVVNDLHRHPLAWLAIRAVGAVFRASPMFRADGPHSVLRGFTRPELRRLLDAAGWDAYQIRWAWAFRWQIQSLHR